MKRGAKRIPILRENRRNDKRSSDGGAEQSLRSRRTLLCAEFDDERQILGRKKHEKQLLTQLHFTHFKCN